MSKIDSYRKYPTPIFQVLDNYERVKDLHDPLLHYRYLESLFSVTLKYTSVCILAYLEEASKLDYHKASTQIFSSSSLGGWVEALNSAVISGKLTGAIQPLVAALTRKKKHPSHLVKFYEQAMTSMDNIESLLKEKGYRFDSRGDNQSIIDIWKRLVTVRNKAAHGLFGKTDEFVFDGIQRELKSCLYAILSVLDLGTYILVASDGARTHKCVGNGKFIDTTTAKGIWIEYNGEKDISKESSPFVKYVSAAQEMYFLNSSHLDSDPATEYINYGTSSVKALETEYNWNESNSLLTKPRNPKSKFLVDDIRALGIVDLKWTSFELTKLDIDVLPTSGNYIYKFYINVKLPNSKEMLLYIGKSKNLSSRMTEYYRVKMGYSDKRVEISSLFANYDGILKCCYCSVDSERKMIALESSLINVFLPPANLVIPNREN